MNSDPHRRARWHLAGGRARRARRWRSALAACDKPAPTPRAAARPPATTAAPAAAAKAAAEHADAGIAWRQAANDAEVDAAFASARSENKPVFVYWGAKWCPPCNQVKATLFNRQDFIERSRAFVPVYVDGDSPGAQKIGARFKVSGYPTMVLFTPQGQEVTRLPGEVEPVRYTEVLTLGMNAARPVSAVLADALARPATLTANDWRLLAFYSWDTDHQQVIAKDAPAGDAARARRRLPEGRARHRDAAAPEGARRRRREASRSAVDAATRAAVIALLGDAARTREQTDMVTNYAAEIVRAMSAKGSADRAALRRRLRRRAEAPRGRPGAVARRPHAGADRAGRPGAHRRRRRRRRQAGREAGAPVALPAALLADVRAQTARADREITDGYERQAVITAAAYLLEHAGLGAESDALLKANLAKSHSPYYLMSELASNAKKRGDKAEALRWYREAFEKSEGPATRLQWGASYVECAGRPRARRRGGDRGRHRAAVERGRGAARRVLRAQRALAAEGRRQAAGLEQGRRAPRRDGAAARQARHPVRRADAQRERALDLPGAAQGAGQADRLSGARGRPRRPCGIARIAALSRAALRSST